MALCYLQHGTGRNLLLVCLGLFFIAAVLQIVGFIAPGWVVWNDSDYSLNRGIWYFQECKNDTCSTSSYDTDVKDADLSGVTRDMGTYQIRTSLGLVFSLLSLTACAVGLKLLCKGKTWGVHILTFAWNLNGGTGGTALAAAIDFGIKVRNSHDSFGDLSKMESPYGVFLTGIGACCALLAGIIGVSVVIYAWCCHKNSSTEDTDSYKLPEKKQPL